MCIRDRYIALPYDGLSISALLDYDTATLNGQYACMNSLQDYEKQIAPCRTFVLLSELEKLAKTGLIKGGSLDNAIVYVDKKMSKKALLQLAKKLGKSDEDFSTDTAILNTKKLQFSNEAARHKVLDLLGDLTLINKPIKGKIIATKPGHQSNIAFAKILKDLFIEQKKLKGKPKYDPRQKPLYDSVAIQELLPHRHPFLLSLIHISEPTRPY